MLKYSLTSQADVDLDDIVEYIAKDNVEAALAIDERITKIFEMLSDNPRIGRERPEFDCGLRSFPADNYLVFYRIWAGKIVIVRVLHATRDLNEIFS